MFTGIVQQIVKVTDIKGDANGKQITIESPAWEVKQGDSITVDGVCSTAKSVSQTSIVFEYMPETLQKSNLGSLQAGSLVNLEPSLKASDRLDGHIVQGHVDNIGQVADITNEGNSKIFKIEVGRPDEFMKFLAPKGSIALDGISLTVVDVGDNWFTVKIIPYTLEKTNLKSKRKNDTVNLEFDVLAKYLYRLVSSQQ